MPKINNMNMAAMETSLSAQQQCILLHVVIDMKHKETLLNAKEQHGKSVDYFIPIIRMLNDKNSLSYKYKIFIEVHRKITHTFYKKFCLYVKNLKYFVGCNLRAEICKSHSDKISKKFFIEK